MDCVTVQPWIWATMTAAGISLVWGAIVQLRMTPGRKIRGRGIALGALEGVIFTMTFAGFAIVGAAWLGFKVASKWKSWSLMAEALQQEGTPVSSREIDTQYHRFLVGTAGNVLIGLVGAAVGFTLGGKPFAL